MVKNESGLMEPGNLALTALCVTSLHRTTQVSGMAMVRIIKLTNVRTYMGRFSDSCDPRGKRAVLLTSLAGRSCPRACPGYVITLSDHNI